MRAQGLEAELRLVAAAEQRTRGEVSILSTDKFRLAAELEAARSAHADRESELLRELGKLREEVRPAPGRERAIARPGHGTSLHTCICEREGRAYSRWLSGAKGELCR